MPDTQLQPETLTAPLSIIAFDDDADFRQYIRGVLETQGHEVRAVSTPEEFYNACESRLPDIILLDMKMGDVSGESVLVEVRKRWPRLCVIVVTGYPSLDSMRKTFKQDAFDYLAKPFSLPELKRCLAQAADAYSLGRRPQDRLRHELGRQIRLAHRTRMDTQRPLRILQRQRQPAQLHRTRGPPPQPRITPLRRRRFRKKTLQLARKLRLLNRTLRRAASSSPCSSSFPT